jgi:hypothetical protein
VVLVGRDLVDRLKPEGLIGLRPFGITYRDRPARLGVLCIAGGGRRSD